MTRRNTRSASDARTKARRQHVKQRHTSVIMSRRRSDNAYAEQQMQRVRPHTGVHLPPEAYSGPGRFELFNPLVQAQLAQGIQLRGRPPTPFVVSRDERLIRPYGGFRVSWRGIEVGRTLSWPTYDDCRRLREHHRYSGLASREELKLLSEVAL